MLAILMELLSRFWPSPAVYFFLQLLEHLPEMVLHLLGLLEPLEKALHKGVVSVLQVRLAYGAAALLGLVVLSISTGLCLWLLQRILRYWASRYEV
jgi:hypothetical protein